MRTRRARWLQVTRLEGMKMYDFTNHFRDRVHPKIITSFQIVDSQVSKDLLEELPHLTLSPAIAAIESILRTFESKEP